MTAHGKDESGGLSEQLQSALDASGVVGTWDWDLVRRIARYDRGAAELLALDPDLAGRDIRGDMAMVGIHPDDRVWLRNEVGRSVGIGGVFLAEYRVVSARGEVRWLLSRGRIYQDPHGRPVRSKGILIDITESRDESQGYVAMPKERVQHPIDRAAGLLLEARKALDESGAEVPSHVRVALDLALFEVGTQIARRSHH
ncbi:PAS domain-containing protein [Methylobacterium aerolatum]|uniref:histidine kinase n=1 Tax=Methylobacterium aerolatum TaxID=418708 RepID=A0ABU0HW38_9HYPH|nr:PAS domain-containing protein [Methylobacterium aerolatum]MDQ0446552.1 hypothetical protein [Methylobacterium aerolatum]GJD33287.1 hypothetical protein FMGBMHLM_0173 [Methylobacterium aerolatum]